MRTVKSTPGMTQEDALLSLQRHARATNEEIVSFVHRSNRWVAELQKIAEFPPAEDKPEKDPADDAPPSEDGPPSEDEGDSAPEGDSPIPGSAEQGPEGEKGEEKGELKHMLSLITQIADKLGIVPEGHGDKLGDEGPMPPGPPVPGGDPGLGGGAKPAPLPTKLHPGEVLPHQTPVGAPAFASVHQSIVPGAGVAPAMAPPSPPCSKCGGPTQGGVCPNCTSAAGAIQASVIDPSGVVGKKRTIEAKVDQPMSEIEAFRQATAAFASSGYSVRQLVPQADGTWLAVLEG